MHPKNQNKNKNNHLPVLLDSVLHYIEPRKGEKYLDLTAGYGGHAEAILERTKNPNGAVLVDRDAMAIESLHDRFGKSGVEIIQKDFFTASQELKASGRTFELILADLGVSSPHLDIASRGFSFNIEGPLDMRMDQSQQLNADTVVNNYSQPELARLIKAYGEDPKANRIASLIANNRPIHNTSELALIVAKAWPGHQKVHPATRTFQAIRIAVNDELELLKQSLPIWFDLLAPGGRIVIISFHSLEDRLVKQAMQDRAGNTYDATMRILTKRPVTGDTTEIVYNPRARSAKLRAAVKIKKEKEAACQFR